LAITVHRITLIINRSKWEASLGMKPSPPAASSHMTGHKDRAGRDHIGTRIKPLLLLHSNISVLTAKLSKLSRARSWRQAIVARAKTRWEKG